MEVPANAEIVIEGYVSTEAGGIGFDPRPRYGEAPPQLGPGAVFEGPFGDHTGFYSLPDRYPIFTATAVTHRGSGSGGPIYPTTIVGRPPMEDYYLGKATERVFLPLLKTLIPDILDYDLPMFGCFHNCAFIRIDKQYPLHARRVMHAIWGAGQMAWTKCIVVVDADVDVHDHEAVLFHLMANFDPGRDIELANGPLDILDHAAPRLGAGTKIGLDATRKIAGEEGERPRRAGLAEPAAHEHGGDRAYRAALERVRVRRCWIGAANGFGRAHQRGYTRVARPPSRARSSQARGLDPRATHRPALRFSRPRLHHPPGGRGAAGQRHRPADPPR